MECVFRLNLLLSLMVTYFLLPAVVDASEKATTCDFLPLNIHHLSCQHGVIQVDQAMYGRTNSLLCSEGVSKQMLSNVKCSQDGVEERMKASCNGKTTCELNTDDFRRPDPCVGTLKYLQTNYTCQNAITVIACENSEAYLFCDFGSQLIIHGADYGRRDRTTCSFQKPMNQLENTSCMNPTNIVADGCNGKETCTIPVSSDLFGDPCKDTAKYLEVAYSCKSTEKPSFNSQ
ncbi:L-rhamnose-binding lectin SML-like [Stigmatopora argus]